MKIIKFGRWSAVVMDVKIDFHSYACMYPSPYIGITDYHQNRRNGGIEDGPITSYPMDGKFTWIKGRVSAPEEVFSYQGSNGKISYGYYIYGEDKKDGTYEYELYYEEGPEDRKFFLQIDQRYLSRIEREGNLELLEPVIWYLRQNRTDNIRDWWAEMFDRPDLPEILEKAEQEYIHIKGRSSLVILLDKAIQEATIDGVIHVKRVIDQYHIDLNSDFLLVISSIMKISRYTKTLDFSDIDLRENYTYLVRIFEKRNCFKCIDLHNTGIDDKALKCLLKALDLNRKIKELPSIEEINLSDNNITTIADLMFYLEKWIADYIDLQQKCTSVVTSSFPFPLRIVNLENNLIKAEKTGGAEEPWLVNYERKLNELSRAINIRFEIILTGNTISACVFNSPLAIELNAGDSLKFFGSASLVEKKSRIWEEAHLNLNRGCVYLSCRSDAWTGHLVIYTELLNSTGQIEVNRLELFSEKVCCSEEQSAKDDDKKCSSHSNGKVCISLGEINMLRRDIASGKVAIRGGYLKTNLIQQLIHNASEDIEKDRIRYSIDGVLGHNCSTWIFEKLKEVGVHLPPTIIPRNAVPRNVRVRFEYIDLSEKYSEPIEVKRSSYCLVM